MNFPCAVEHDLRIYERQQDKDAEFDAAAEQRADEMMLRHAECDPLDATNLQEAITEASDADFKQLATFLCDGDDAAAGIYLRKITQDYWRKYSLDKAGTELEKMVANGGDV